MLRKRQITVADRSMNFTNNLFYISLILYRIEVYAKTHDRQYI